MGQESQEPVSQGAELAVIPEGLIEEEVGCLYPGGLGYFSPERYAYNVGILKLCRQYAGARGPNFAEVVDQFSFPVLDLSVPRVIQMVDQIKASPPAVRNLRAETPSNPISPSKIADSDIQTYIKELVARHQRVCLVSPSHATDVYLLRSLIEAGIDPARTGVFVFDAHFDGIAMDPDQFDKPPHKSNILNYLLQMGIGGIALTGLSHYQFTEYINGKVIGAGGRTVDLEDMLEQYSQVEFQPLHPHHLRAGEQKTLVYKQFYLPNQEKLLVADIFNRQGRLAKREPAASIRQQVEKLAALGVDRLLVSVDADVLDLWSERMTSTEYSPFALIAALGMQDLGKAIEPAGFHSFQEFSLAVERYWNLKQSIRALHKEKNRKSVLSGTKEAILERQRREADIIESSLWPATSACLDACFLLTQPVQSVPDSFRGRAVRSTPKGGFKMRELEQAIVDLKQACRETGINFGIQTKTVGTVYGSISEVAGPDLDGNTARVVKRIAQALASE